MQYIYKMLLKYLRLNQSLNREYPNSIPTTKTPPQAFQFPSSPAFKQFGGHQRQDARGTQGSQKFLDNISISSP